MINEKEVRTEEQNSEKVHNLQCPDEKVDMKLACNILMKENISATIRIGQDIRCLPYVVFLVK